MACFSMWIVIFITLAIFIFYWRYMGFAWFTWKDKDFSQMQGGYYQRLHNEIPNLEEWLKTLNASSKGKVLNKNQCVHLFGKLIEAVKGIDKILSIATLDLKFQFVCEELFVLQKKIEMVRNNCIEEERWCHSIVFQLQNKETFRELLLDLKCCYDTARDIYLFDHPNQPNDIRPIQFDVAIYDQVLEDEQELKKKLDHLLKEEISEDYDLAQHLLLRLRNLDRVDGGDLNDLEVPIDFKPRRLIQKIGQGGSGGVYKSSWLGLKCATKVLKGDPEYLMDCQKEAGILAGLSHPNLVQFFGCGIIQKVGGNSKEVEIGGMHWTMEYLKSSLSRMLKSLIPSFDLGIIRNIDENLKEDETGEMHLVMELMDSNLSTILKKSKRPLPCHVALDIMLQIAKGVYYLHDMQVAHLDLKPDNVLCSSISMEDLDPCCTFKVMDYGTSQMEVCSNPKHPEPTNNQFGTPRYMAPEMIKGSKTPRYPFQADVWSFAMICSEILSRKVPYSHLKPRDIYYQLLGPQGPSFRPTLPNDCQGLTTLIQECWSQDPLQRPTFSTICDRLTSLKKSLLKGGPCALRDSQTIVNHVPRVDEPIDPTKEIRVDLNHQLSKAKGLLKMKYIGIVGMGGIGKTTLAKAIFHDPIVKSSYNASCFIDECKNYPDSYEILYKILSKVENDKKPQHFEDAQKMMKDLLVKRKVLLVLDDIKDERQVLDIVCPDFVQTSKGTTIIITTRNWSTIKSFVGMEGRLDVELLDEKASTTLFTSHLYLGVASLSSDFGALRKQVVKACNGLPLSLKVMGAFLRNKERLRSWERALQRMVRGRNLDGDEEIWNTLQISFDGLNDGVEKRMFLDVACFFCRDVHPFGISKAMILTMWSKDGVLPLDELNRLIDMSLLKVNGDGDILEMHDQLRDMGRMIAKHRRIWKASMLPESGCFSKDVEDLEGISLRGTMKNHLPNVKHDPTFNFEKLRVLILGSASDNPKANVENLESILEIALQYALLKILDLRGVEFMKTFSNKFVSRTTLLILILRECSSLATLPKEVGNLSSLTTLNLSWCEILAALPKEVGNLSSLTTLHLSYCSSLAALPKEVGNLSSLTTLDLSYCSSLVALPKEVGNLSSLTTLKLSRCSSLAALPKEVGNLSSLTTLKLSQCSSLAALPKEVGNLSSLTTLDLSYCSSLAALPKEVGNLSSLTTLDLSYCSSLVALPKEVGNLSSLATLDLTFCLSLAALPKEVEKLSSLTTLDLSYCSSLVALPKEVGNLSSLTTLKLSRCSSLVALPKEVGNLSSLTTLHLSYCSSLAALPKEVGNLSSLTTLDLSRCSSLAALPKEVGNLSSLTTLNLSGCSSLAALRKEVGKLSSLTTLDLSGCSSLAALPKEVGNLSSLTTLDVHECKSLAALPKEVGNLSSLTTLSMSYCRNLAALPKEVGNLSSLTTLDLSGYSSLANLPKEVGNLSFLTTLDLSGYSSLANLPKEVGNLSSLTTLNFSGCESLAALPKEVGNLSSLTTLDLSGYSSLANLPKEVGNLSFLTTLDLSGYSSLANLPKEVGNLSSLTTLNFSGCESLAALPKEVGNLSSLTTLNLSRCSNLAALSNEVGNLSSLTTLLLIGCESLTGFPKEVGNLSSLTTLNLRECKSLTALPKEVGNLSSLTTLNLSRCSNLAALSNEVGNLSSLTTLLLIGCESLTGFPKEVGNLSSLTTLNLRECKSLTALPKEVGNLSSLTTLNLRECKSLAALPKEVGNLTSLTTLDLSGCSSLVVLPKDIENLYHLVKLNLNGCILLRSLPKNLGCSPAIRFLSWNDCPNLEPYMLAELSPPTSVANLEGKFFCIEGDYHYKVFCDGCKEIPIIGPRFKAKATFKINYDLCLDCFTKWKLLLENSGQ